MSTFTTALDLELIPRGADTGIWDTPTNSNWSIVDAAIGQIATISLNNSNVVLSAAQFQCRQITFNSTLTGSVTITFPSTFTKDYLIEHACTGSSAFTITLATTASGGLAICPPPGEAVECFNDGTNLKYRNFGRIGSYMDYAGSSVPNWVSGCTIPPYLNCDGTSVSSNSYPVLFGLIGATLPDLRGRAPVYANQGTGRVTSSGGLDGNTLFAGGGSQTTTLSSLHLPQLSDPGHFHTTTGGLGGSNVFGITVTVDHSQSQPTDTKTTGITYGSSAQIGAPIVQPSVVTGLRLIRAA